ncbi:Mitochondrial import inner membrane translocase subunit tim8 [Didymella sp. IMI 355093]|nr:Mitochondrial import inner membrane translocase subunit tim8 [Didymella sp. IMI 355093]
MNYRRTDFEFAFGVNSDDEVEAALALLGSPNGIAAAYFLIQHKEQLGWKYVWNVKIFLSSGKFPDTYILFYVSDQPPWEGPISNIGAQLVKLQCKPRRKRSQCVASKEGQNNKVKRSKKMHRKAASRL